MRNYKFKIKSVKTMDKELYKFMKVCKDCGQLKLMIKFSKGETYKDGRKNKCIKCRNEKQKKYPHICEYCGIEFIGKKCQKFHSEECRNKWYGDNHKGKNNPMFGKERPDFKGENNPNWKGGKISVPCDYCGKSIPINQYNLKHNKHHFCSKECDSKWRSENLSGENSSCWNPNLTQEEREKGRKTHENNQWRIEVFKRDNYTCQCCGDNKGGNLNAHHLNSHNWDKENRTNVDNGITLCEMCHKEFHHIYGYGNNTKEQFEEYLKQQNKDNTEVA